jgi:hypothetical protein
MASPDVSRFPGGISDAADNAQFANFAGLRPNRYFIFDDDFTRFNPTDWVVTETAAGSTQAINTDPNGVLALTNVAAGAADATSIQWAGGSGAVSPQFVWQEDRDFLLYSRFKLSNPILSSGFIGLADADTSPVASVPLNGIYFVSTGLVAAVTGVIIKAGNTTAIFNMGNIGNATFIECLLYYNSSKGTWQAFRDNAIVGTVYTPDMSPTAQMAPTIGLMNASAAAHSVGVDRLFIAKQR